MFYLLYLERGAENVFCTFFYVKLKSVYFSGTAGIGVEYKFTHKFSFVLMPTARFALNSINKDAVVKTFPNAVGLSAGLKIKF